MAGGIWQVAGGIWEVAGGIWEVAGEFGRWPWQLASVPTSLHGARIWTEDMKLMHCYRYLPAPGRAGPGP